MKLWTDAGWDSPEDFEQWFDALADRHPRRGRERFAKDHIVINLVLKGKVQHRGRVLRQWLEDCHAAYRETKDWRGGYAPTLFAWLSDETWHRYPQGAVEKKQQQFRCAECGDTGQVVIGDTGADMRFEMCPKCGGQAAA